MLRLASELRGPKWESLCVVPQRRFLSFRVEACGSGTCQIHKGDLEWRRCAGHTWGASADEKWRLNNTVWNTTFESIVTSVWQRQRASFTAPILCCLYLSAQNISLFFHPICPAHWDCGVCFDTITEPKWRNVLEMENPQRFMWPKININP